MPQYRLTSRPATSEREKVSRSEASAEGEFYRRAPQEVELTPQQVANAPRLESHDRTLGQIRYSAFGPFRVVLGITPSFGAIQETTLLHMAGVRANGHVRHSEKALRNDCGDLHAIEVFLLNLL
jgi:hypothetical protein